MDDDGDGLIDCQDPVCCDNPIPTGTSTCATLSETIKSQQAIITDAQVVGTLAAPSILPALNLSLLLLLDRLVARAFPRARVKLTWKVFFIQAMERGYISKYARKKNLPKRHRI